MPKKTETKNTKKKPETLGDEPKKVKLTHQERRFGQPNGNPRGHGFWKIEDTPRYKLEKMMKMSEKELMEVYADKNAPLFERKLASFINKGEWDEIRGMIQEVYGTPKSTVVTKVEVSDPYEGLTTEELKKLLAEKDQQK